MGKGGANLSLAGGVTVNRLDDRTRLLTGLDRLKREADGGGAMKAMDSFAERAVSVITSGAVAKRRPEPGRSPHPRPLPRERREPESRE